MNLQVKPEPLNPCSKAGKELLSVRVGMPVASPLVRCKQSLGPQGKISGYSLVPMKTQISLGSLGFWDIGFRVWGFGGFGF